MMPQGRSGGQPEDHVPMFRWAWASLTDPGRVREVNEDAATARLLPQAGLWAVADGMGGHSAGDVASRMVVDALDAVRWHARPEEFLADVLNQLQEANRSILDFAEGGPEPRTMGSTVAVLLCMRRNAVVVWAGDSRVYRLRGGRLERLTRDHSEVEEMVEQGLILREDAEAHPSANVITRAVGVSNPLDLELHDCELRDGDRYLLCSDGLYKELSESEMAERLAAGGCDEACRSLVDGALARGGRDNVTVIVAECRELD